MTTRVKPNVVLFMCDQLSAKWLEAAGDNDICDLPNFDWLRENGTTFTNAITSNPVCSPARATIATGLCSRAHGLIMNGYFLNPEIPTFMHALQKEGWRTGAFGKLHLRPHYERFYQDYSVYGFDVVHNTEDDRSGEWLDWVKEEHPEHYQAALATCWPDVPGYAEYGPDKVDLRPEIREAKKQFPGVFSKTLPFPEEVSQSAWITSRAVGYIAKTPPDRPLFAHVSFVAPHPPYCPPAETMDKVAPENIPAALPAEWLHSNDAPEYYKKLARFLNNESDDRPVWMDTVIRRGPGGGPASADVDFADNRHRYFADIVHLDQQLGRVRKALEDCGRLDSTFIVFTADHGELLGDHGFMQKQERHYDGGIRVPLVIAGPGLRENAMCNELVQLEDICPTILELTGAPVPQLHFSNKKTGNADDTCPQISGRSLAGICRGETPDDWRQEAYVESYPSFGPGALGAWARSVRTSKYRYTYYPDGNGEQLFDLEADPDEQQNLACDPEHAALRQELKDRLMEQMIRQDVPVPPRDLFRFGIH